MATETKAKTFRMKIRRQDTADSRPYWEEFDVELEPNMNVLAALMAIQRNPVNIKGERVAPVVWEQNCLEEICGACTMLINGRVRQGCTALIDQLEKPVVLEPMQTFPTIRDLAVDRSAAFENLKRIKGWIPIDGTYPLGPGPRESEEQRQIRYELSKCFTCAACMEACPNYTVGGNWIGPQAINQVRYFNMHPTGALTKDERLDAVMGPDGITSCGQSQNCVEVCPKGIPLTTSLAVINRDTTIRGITRWLTGRSKKS